MSSTFVNTDEIYKKEGLGSFQIPAKVFLQFIPGIVRKVITNTGKVKDAGAIIAKPYIKQNSTDLDGALEDSKKYIPLLRGISDTPTKGDVVLLVTFGNIEYYLGPINTLNHANFNPSPWEKKGEEKRDFEVSRTEAAKKDILGTSLLENIQGLTDGQKAMLQNDTTTMNQRDEISFSENFVIQSFPHLQKKYKSSLDNRDLGHGFGIANSDNSTDQHGDMLLEGRHGNSIRIGSRYNNPYMIFSNGREPGNQYESLWDGNLVGLFERGSIHHHFSDERIFYYGQSTGDTEALEIAYNEFKKSQGDGNPGISNEYSVPYKFKLASDEVSNPALRPIGKQFDYNFGNYPEQNYFFLTTDRVVLNARNESIYISSKENTHIGSGGDFIVDTTGDTIIESDNIYLGKHARLKKVGSKSPYDSLAYGVGSEFDRENQVFSEDVNYEKMVLQFNENLDGCTEEDYEDRSGPCYEEVPPEDSMRGPAEPLVLGEQLRIILFEILDAMESLKVTNTILGTSGPVDKLTYDSITSIKSKIKNVTSAPFNSEYHFIESNKYSVYPGFGGNAKLRRSEKPPEVNATDDVPEAFVDEEFGEMEDTA